MEDEQGMHECPRCGLLPNAKRCGDCGRWFVPEHRSVLLCLDCGGHMSYRFDSPYEWLADTAREWNAARLYQELLNLARLLDSDTLQDEYQTDMSLDGYFEPDTADTDDSA